MVEKLKVDNYDVEAEFIRKKYDFYRWDINVYENENLVATAVDFNSEHRKAELAVREFLQEQKED